MIVQEIAIAREQALILLGAIITRQAAVLSHNRVFVSVSLVFFLNRGHAAEHDAEIMID